MHRVDEARRAAEQVARESYGRLVAFLAARTRDVAGAEDALAEAFAAALQTWPTDGIPTNPPAWLLTVARRRQTDALRRRQTRSSGEEHLKLMADEIEAAAEQVETIPDRRLGLMFACAHPAIERGMRAPLILQTILGLTAEDIAAAFLIAPKTMGQRLVRAKTKIKAAGVPFRLPERTELPERLDAVLEAIYGAYSKGWGELDGPTTPQLVDEAIWLGRLVVSLLPEEAEALGMLALMLYAEARRPARQTRDGAYVPLADQDTRLWDVAMIDEAESLLRRANTLPATGRYQLEAAIQSAHAVRRVTGRPDWRAVAELYARLLDLTGSPVVGLNRAMAVAEVEGTGAGLAILDRLHADPRMEQYQPYWAARAELLARAERHEEADAAYALAIGLATDPAIRGYLRGRRTRLAQ